MAGTRAGVVEIDDPVALKVVDRVGRCSGMRVSLVLGAIVVIGIGCVAPGPGGKAAPGSGSGSGGGENTVAGCPMFPADHVWNADVSGLGVHSRSADWVGTIGAGRALKADFGSGTWDGGPIGIPFTSVGAGQAKVPVSFQYHAESDPGPYPIPPNAPVEHGSDHHVLVVDSSSCVLHELYDAERLPNGSWTAGSGARFDLRGYALRPAGWTSADAAGLAILPGLVRYEEVASGRIQHPVRFTAPQTQRAYLWPARHFASSSTDPNRPPMGAWFRLRADFDTSELGPQSRVVAEALKRHGMILADNGSSWYVSGAPDSRWNNDDLRGLSRIKGSDLVAVDASSLMIHPDSGRIRR